MYLFLVSLSGVVGICIFKMEKNFFPAPFLRESLLILFFFFVPVLQLRARAFSQSLSLSPARFVCSHLK